jgi:hypothetical protein
MLAILPRSRFGLSPSKESTGQVGLEGSFDLDTSADKALQSPLEAEKEDVEQRGISYKCRAYRRKLSGRLVEGW